MLKQVFFLAKCEMHKIPQIFQISNVCRKDSDYVAGSCLLHKTAARL